MDNYMVKALEEAKKSIKHNDVPVGAVIVENNKIIARAHNTKEKKQNVSRHAEIIAIEKACKKKKNWHLNNCIMYVTLEPCMMCWAAINQARIGKVIYALPREKRDILDYTQKILGDGAEKSHDLLNDFFATKRK